MGRSLNIKFGKRLRLLRKVKAKSLAQVAGLAAMDVKFLADLEHGRKEACLGTLKKVSRGLRVTISELMEGL